MPQKQITKYQVKKIDNLIKGLPLAFPEVIRADIEQNYKDIKYMAKEEADILIRNIKSLKSNLSVGKVLTIKGYIKV